ncbi:MAG: hypothetical protein KGO81_11160 [Bacteroidota bacterium]|nr:hypothetical protein [Bacteroidota bacterium]
MVKKLLGGAFLLLFFTISGHAQDGRLTGINWTDTSRLQQLIGRREDSVSYTLRGEAFAPLDCKRSRFTIAHLRAGITVMNNSSLPYTYNAGSFYPAAGVQTRITGGALLQYGHFSLQLFPELVRAANTAPNGLDPYFDRPNYWPRYYEAVLNRIDLPDYFGTAPLQKLYPGQSSFLYNTRYLSLGISTENVWWGPGLRNALTLSNSAPGFLHYTLRTNHPIPTPIGSIEGEWLTGYLSNSGILPPENQRLNNVSYYIAGNQDKRMLTGLTVSWQPKWIPHLFVGFTKAYYQYQTGFLWHDAIPFGHIDSSRRSLGSLFARYVMPADHAELYVEYGRGDRPATLTNIFYDTIPTAYTIGLRKLFPLRRSDRYLSFGLEICHLQLPDAKLIFQNAPALLSQAKTWYVDQYIRQGYTQDGRLLGASIGPGSNSQTLTINWLKGVNKFIGITLERVVHNNDFYYYNYFNGLVFPGPNFEYWADLSAALHWQWQFGKFNVAANLQYTSALNYKWVKLGGGGLWDPSSISDKKNIQSTFSLYYLL